MMLRFPRPRAVLTAVLGPMAALTVLAGSALAQDMPPGAVGGGAPPGDRSVCIRLEGQLAALDRGGSTGQPDVGAQIAQLQQGLADLTGQARQLGCDKRGFLIFQPQLPPQCDALNRRIAQTRTQLDRTMMQARGDQGGTDEQRRQLVYALAQNNCGAQYQAALGQPQGGYGNAPQQRRAPRNLFEQLFGVPRNLDEEAGPLDVQPLEMPKVSTYRTVCVRTCDGFFFPVSFAATPAKFGSDEAQCQRQCPGTEARLFAYRNPGEDIEQAVGTNGQPYMSLPNALLYKKQFVAACSCRPAGMSWAQALSQEDDPTLRKGDIVVTEDASREMAQPRPATPAAPAKKP
ncbi:DUF2865 domain-containing protein [Ancylobacter sp. SL191]|uniref:DUF2865 domain-containing protein n=1 Tax=Ancylobacter sp. SL191 TaxID=2995166 RepID=UPI00226E1D7F|nr:DUF2865 domain-containing protein [Ancylobacter sp. SL191]WAC27071.1 DUF2865 domain-containing protein [Ancylobacter sp. SL191]